MAKILCVDDSASELLILRRVLEDAGHATLAASHVPEALQILERERVDLIISDYRMPEVTGLELLSILARDGYDIPLIMSTAFGTIEDAVSAIKAGAVDYITKPIRREQIELAVGQALELLRLRKENAELREQVAHLRTEREILGDSPVFRRVLQTVATVAPTRATVLVQGESGTGKELLARAIHELSPRATRAFVAVNCAALPESLIESSLFGHEKGAFTGAVRRVEGAFERADGGTLLLDEISEMGAHLQAKLLRVLQEQEFERLGGDAPIRVDVRVVATTNRDLMSEVEKGTFREDLYYRLNVVPLHVPPLRERGEDIALLAHRLALQAAARHGKAVTGIAADALELLRRYTWPGNVRELAHAVERAVILAAGPVLDRQSFAAAGSWLAEGAAPGRLAAPGGGAAAPGEEPAVRLHTLDLRSAEAALIAAALERTGGNRTRAARLLGITDRTLRNKLNRPSTRD